MPVRPMLLHRMALVSFRLFCKNLGNLQQLFGQMVYRPPWQNIARTPMLVDSLGREQADAWRGRLGSSFCYHLTASCCAASRH